MKHRQYASHLRIHKGEIPAYPNAAKNSYFAQKTVNVLTAIASGMGLITAMVVLISFT